MSEENFAQTLKGLAESAIIKIIREGAWIQPSYKNRVELPETFMKEVWDMVDVSKVQKGLAKRIEEELAERLVNHMAQELSTDIKQVLSVKERREAIRSVVRENLDRLCKTPTESKEEH